ncbi:MAG TPA: cation acetate symporter [Pirellulaceae bacterium]|jgi:cation/acetate symporter
MNPQASWIAIGVFAFFVALVLGTSFYLGRKAKSASGYYAAHGQIPWFVNGVAFAGDYLSAASFLGICGMIAFYGYDGFLYSIGFLAGWIVALLVIAEPLKRLGKFTFADALDSQFNSRGIKLAAAVSTLVVSIFYLIPQMVGAGSLVKPLLGLSHSTGVVTVGVVVILIVVTAGMVSTTWVQFIKGGMLVIFCAALTVMILNRGLSVPVASESPRFGVIESLPDGKTSTGPLGPILYLKTLQESTIVMWTTEKVTQSDGTTRTNYIPKSVRGSELLVPGGSPTFKGVRSAKLGDKLDFLSLMIALFCGTASLPHILIRYYTVKDQASARKSTVVGIASIGFFYILTLFLGLGAMTSGTLNVTDSNMAAPLLARSFGELPFAVISAIAFTTVLGTVSGLIMAASGAVAHDLMANFLRIEMNDHSKVRAGKITAVVVGLIAIWLGIVFQKLNVGFLVGWAFNVAASANLPSLVMLLFWRGTTKQGITAAIFVGMLASLGWILLSQQCYRDVYGLPPEQAIVPFSQPGIVTIPLGFVVLIGVSLLTRRETSGSAA